MVKIFQLLLLTLLLSSCSIIVIKHKEGSLPKLEIKDNSYFCQTGKTKIDVDEDELVVTCRVPI